MIVMKFGGTSNQDADAMRNVIRIVTSHIPEKPVVVISAIARATNELEQIARTAESGQEEEANRLLDQLLARHTAIARDLVSSRQGLDSLQTMLDDAQAGLRKLVQGVSIVRELTPRMMDAICSHGERLSSAIVAAGLAGHGVASVWVDAKDFMVTNDSFGNAVPLMDVVTERLRERVAPLIDQGKVPVTQGFIGVTVNGASTTMGRESSDFSASIIGAAMGAELVQIWTDVDGILTADPTLVPHARVVREMSFEEAFELSWFGAKVLHPNTMLPLLERKIPAEIRNSRNAGAEGTRVCIQQDHRSADAWLKSVTFQKGMVLFSVKPNRRSDRYLFWEGVFSTLAKHNLQSDISVTSEYALTFAVKGVRNPDELRRELEEFGNVAASTGKASITLVGKGVCPSSDIVPRVFRALSDTRIFLITYGASELSLSVILDDDRVSQAVNRLHEEFFR